MTKYVIGPDVAVRLAAERATIRDEHHLLAPSLIRSQILTWLYAAVRDTAMTRAQANQHLVYVRSLRLRLLGDHVLQRTAWNVADRLGWANTFDAEYVALTQLHADAFITLDPHLASAASAVVEIAPIDALY